MSQCTNCMSHQLKIEGDTAECKNCGAEFILCNCCNEFVPEHDTEVLNGEPFGEGSTCTSCYEADDHYIPRN
jgi:formylmethanofuran dehydrogenase subunit E